MTSSPCFTPLPRVVSALTLLLLLASASLSPAGPPTESGPTSTARADDTPPSAQVAVARHYYVAAEEVEWNYAPSGENQIRPDQDLGEWGGILTYKKVRYIEYTDETYTTPSPQPDHRGILGPEIRGVVGDTLTIHFVNKSHRPVSMHPHGVFYNKDSEGAPYAGIDAPGQAVPPGGRHKYVWQVPERAGPGPADGSSVVWAYHSHVNCCGDDIQAGLIGTIVIVARGMATEDAHPKDVDREFTTLFLIFDENADGGEEEVHLKHTINGRIFGNLPGFTMKKGERVRWYLIGMGSELDLHTPHWHGTTALQYGHRRDVIDLLPGTMTVADTFPDNVGTWMLHCHVADHMTAGMNALYTVEP